MRDRASKVLNGWEEHEPSTFPVTTRWLLLRPASPLRFLLPDGRHLDADASRLVVLGPGRPLRCQLHSPEPVDALWFALRTPMRGNQPTAGVGTAEVGNHEFLRLVTAVHAIQTAPEVAALLVDELRLVLDRLLLRLEPQPPSTARRLLVEEARYRVGASAAGHTLGLRELARELSCSEAHLSRAFKREYGRGLARFRRETRQRLAVERILAGADDLLQVALSVGYQSHAHFTSAFKQVFGLVPSEFRSRPLAWLEGVRAERNGTKAGAAGP